MLEIEAPGVDDQPWTSTARRTLRPPPLLRMVRCFAVPLFLGVQSGVETAFATTLPSQRTVRPVLVAAAHPRRSITLPIHDLPLIEHTAARGGDTFAFIFTGDGNWAMLV